MNLSKGGCKVNIFKKMLSGRSGWKENRSVVAWLVNLAKTNRKYIFGFLVINMLTMGVSLGSAVAGKYVVDAARGDQWMPISIMLVTSLVSIAIASLASLFSSFMGERLSFGIRAQLYDRVQRSVWHKLSKFRSGDLLSRLAGDVDAVASALITMIPNALVSLAQLIIILCLLLYYDPMLALIGLIVGPLSLLCSVFFRKRYVQYQEALRQSHSEYFSFLQETMSSVGVIKTFQLEDENNLRFGEIRNKRMDLVLRTARLSNLMHVLSRLVYGLGYVITFSWCAYQVSELNYPYGVMTLFLTLVSQLEGSIRGLGSFVPQFYSLMVSAKRLYQISELEHEDYTGSCSQPKSISLKVTDVSFHYEDKEDHRHVLRNLDLTIPAGSRVGIVGASGAGKTTFIRLLLALIKPISGTVEYMDENGVSELACPASRRFISYVPQGNTLLPGSVRTNLLSGNPHATEEQMWQALETADAADFLRKSPQGLDTVLSHSAGGLSEGQAQRISIARALLRDKPVLILDEATSALDEATEARIFQQISSLEGRTCFIITHRKSMLRYCDRILTIDADGHGTLTDNV